MTLKEIYLGMFFISLPLAVTGAILTELSVDIGYFVTMLSIPVILIGVVGYSRIVLY